jgi:transcriptional regulator of acetoin/glycerol metabolism
VAVISVVLPPLRERLVDLAQISHSILRSLGRTDVLDRESLQRLQGHRWPGNLRELRQVLLRAVATADGGPLKITIEAASSAPSLRDRRDQSERDTLVELLQRHGGNVSAAARAAEVDRRHLHRLLKKHGLRGG